MKRTTSNCVVEAKVTPETSINKNPYNVSVTINEVDKSITQASCTCQAGQGTNDRECVGVMFLMFFTFRELQASNCDDILDSTTVR